MERFCKSCRDNATHCKASAGPTTLTKDKCAFCNLTPLPAPGFCTACLATERLACARCDIGRKIKSKKLDEFSPLEIFQKKHGASVNATRGYRRSELRRARCLKCMAQAHSQPTRTAPLGQCRNCHKAVSINTLQGYSEATRTGLCRQCQNLAKAPKTCGQCGATHRSPFTQSGTLCENCAYPPCGVCGTTPRPRNSKYHSKKMADWVCGKCSDGQTCTNCHRRLPPGNVANSALCLICRKQTTTSDQLSSGHGPSTKKT